MKKAERAQWWSGATFYQIYVRSFRDSNRDGIGDIAGIVERLGYIESLGVDAIWLSPTMPSPGTDWGYDVSDYLGVHPELGTLEEMDRLISEAGARGIAVLFDLVPNHTSDKHPWFIDALSSEGAPHRDYYVWAPPKGDGGFPNNWLDATENPAWTYDELSDRYYLHNFLPTQPDLNWWHPPVHEEFDRILRWWFDRGVAGFRIDVAHGLYKDALLRDNPSSEPGDHPASVRRDQRLTYSAHRPEVHQVYRRWRKLSDSYSPGRVLLGETWEFDFERLGSYYGREAPELHVAFNFPFFFSELSAPALASVVEATLAHLPSGATPIWTASNHDAGRFPSRWCHGDEGATKAALLVLATLPGTLVLYYGDELGMTDVHVPLELQMDEMSLAHPERPGRDRCRTPMPWQPGPNAGFTAPHVRPWLPVGEHATENVEAQSASPGSMLNFWRRLAALRSAGQLGGAAPMERLWLDDQVWAYRVGDVSTVVNLSDKPAHVKAGNLPATRVLVPTAVAYGQAALNGELVLGPWEAIVLVP